MSARNDVWFGSESNPFLTAPVRGATEEQLERLKEQLLIPFLSSVENPLLARELRWVANEAAALAWTTVCPMLVLPSLLEEKVCAALRRWERQQLLWKRARPSDTLPAKVETLSVLPRLMPMAVFQPLAWAAPFGVVRPAEFVHG